MTTAVDPDGNTYVIQAQAMSGGASVVFVGDRDGEPRRGGLWDPVQKLLNLLHRPSDKPMGALVFVVPGRGPGDPVFTVVETDFETAVKRADSIAGDIAGGTFRPAPDWPRPS